MARMRPWQSERQIERLETSRVERQLRIKFFRTWGNGTSHLGASGCYNSWIANGKRDNLTLNKVRDRPAAEPGRENSSKAWHFRQPVTVHKLFH